MKKYRELSGPCFELLETIPGLRALFDGVRADPELRWEVRLDNTLTCYYYSGALLTLGFKPRDQRVTFEFNPNYFLLSGDSRTAYAELEKWHAGSPSDPLQWLERLDELKAVMDAWKAEIKANREAISQQALTRCNTFATGNYQYIDTEFAVPDHRQDFGQVDMVAVRREEGRYIPVLVELKYGTDATRGDSGVMDHYQKIMRFLSTPNGEADLVESIRRIWSTKERLGLLDAPVPDRDAFGKTELMFAVTGWEDGREGDIRSLLPDKLERTVRIKTCADEKLYFDDAEPLA